MHIFCININTDNQLLLLDSGSNSMLTVDINVVNIDGGKIGIGDVFIYMHVLQNIFYFFSTGSTSIMLIYYLIVWWPQSSSIVENKEGVVCSSFPYQ